MSEITKKAMRRIYRIYGVRQIRKHGFWFVDIPRTSSTSIKYELAKTYGITYAKRVFTEGESPHPWIFPSHLPAQEMRRILGEELWENVFTFTFVRNPWDRMVSLFHYRKEVGSIPKGISFRDYVLQFNTPRYLLKGHAYSSPVYYYGLLEYIVDSDNNVIVDFIGRYENRTEDLRTIANRISCPELDNICLQNTNKSNTHYSEYYDDDTKDVISRVFEKDIDMFEYSFEQKM